MKKVIAFLKKNKKFTVFLGMSLVLVLIAVFAPLIAPYDPYESSLVDAYQGPSAAHRFGTDTLGRDILSRVIFGTRISISSALILVSLSLLIGSLLGLIAGYFGGVVDAVIMRICDMMIAFPDLILAIAIAGILGASLINGIIAILVVSWTKYARLARSMVLKIKNRDYISAARVTGSKDAHIISWYMVPNALPTLVITAATDIGTMMLSLASLSFLGFGVRPPAPEWGYMLSEGRLYIQTYPWMMLYPGMAIFVTVVVFNLLGDSIRDLLDPRDKKKKRKKKKTH